MERSSLFPMVLASTLWSPYFQGRHKHIGRPDVLYVQGRHKQIGRPGELGYRSEGMWSTGSGLVTFTRRYTQRF